MEIRLAILQIRCASSLDANVNQAIRQVREAAEQGAQVVCLPELFRSLYPCQTEDHRHFDLAEPIPGPLTQRLSELARELSVVLISSHFERRAAGVFHNTACVFDADGQLLGKYRKMHVPDDPGYYEKFYFTPGDLGFRSFATHYGNVGVCICWDQWFPEAARLTALQGSDFLFYPTAIGWLLEERDQFGESQVAAWETMLRSHAIANGVFVAAPNRVGREGDIQFWGSSPIIDPNGNVLARGSRDGDELVMATCQTAQIEAVRTHWPFLRDRRIDAYDGLQQRFLDEP